jgi:hypothetical protein
MQIQHYQHSIGRPTMTGAFAFMGNSALGIYSGIALFCIALIHTNKMLTLKEKDAIILIIFLISIPILLFIVIFLGL